MGYNEERNAATVASDRPPGDIVSTGAQLEQAIANLNGRVKRLRELVTGTLRPVPPRPASNDVLAKAPQPARSPIGMHLANLTTTVEKIDASLSDIIDRIQL